MRSKKKLKEQDALSGEFLKLFQEISQYKQNPPAAARAARELVDQLARKAPFDTGAFALSHRLGFGSYAQAEPDAVSSAPGFAEPSGGGIAIPMLDEARALDQVQRLFGGRQNLGRAVKSPLDAHKLLDKGLSTKALNHFVQKGVRRLPRESLLKAIGMSERTYQRYKGVSDDVIGSDQGARAWSFAEILAEATAVFGSQERAETWLDTPALGLDKQRPIDLVTTPVGADLVKDFIGRLKYGVYT